MIKRKKILYFAHVATMFGANRSLLNLISGLSENFDVTVILPHMGPFADELTKRGIQWHIVNFSHTSVKKYVGFYSAIVKIPRIVKISLINTLALIKLTIYFHKQRIHLVHSNSGVITIGKTFSSVLNVPHVWHLREFQDLDYNLEFIFGKLNFLKQLKSSNRVIAISHAIANHFQTLSNYDVIYNGLFTSENITNVKPECSEPYFLFCGALIPEKGLEDAVLAFGEIRSLFPQVILKIVGKFDSVEFEHKILGIIEDHGLLKSIQFLGFQDDVARYMRSSIALFMCSHNEALGRVTLEAMFNKCLVIGFNNAGTAEIIGNANRGLLYSTVSELIELAEFAIVEHTKCEVIKVNAYNFVMKNFTQKAYADKMMHVYNALINHSNE